MLILKLSQEKEYMNCPYPTMKLTTIKLTQNKKLETIKITE